MYYRASEVPTLLITWQSHPVVPNKTEIYIVNKKRKNATAAPYCMLVPWSVAFFAVYSFLFLKMDLHHQLFCFSWSTQCGCRLSSTYYSFI